MKKIILLLSITIFIFSCEEQAANLEEGDTVRMVIQETQCANPWEFSRDQNAYKNHIKSYLQAEGISSENIQILDELPPDTALCMACTCWSGNNIYVSVPASQVDEAEALGFSKVES
jgi:hypothetical protein